MDNIINQLNERLLAAASQVWEEQTDVLLFGITEPVLIRDQESETTLPAIVDPDGECIQVFAECDMHDVTAYHKLNSTSYEQTQSFGSRTMYNRVADMALVVYGKRAINKNAIEKAFVDELSAFKGITLTGTDYGATQIIASEYSGMPFFLNADFFCFKINYRLTSTLAAGCTK